MPSNGPEGAARLPAAGQGPLLIRGSWWPGDILVDVTGRIAAVGHRVTAPPETPRLDARGAICSPGLVNTHHHLFQRLTRGFAVGCDVIGWLRTLLPRWAGIPTDDLVTGARLGLAEAALAGISTTVDHHFVRPPGGDDPWVAIAAAAEDVGLRLVLARGVVDLTEEQGGIVPPELAEDPETAMGSIATLADRLARTHPDITLAVAPSSLFAVSRALLAAASELAAARGLPLHLHLSEHPSEVAVCLARHRRRPVELLDELGWLDQPMWLAHGIHLPPVDLRRVAAAGAGVAHCPASNLRLGSGVCPVARWRAAGAPVGLGTDGAASNEAGSQLGQARLASSLASGDDSLPPADAFALATAEGAVCLGRPELGRLEVGAPADIAVWPAEDLADLLPDAPTAHDVGAALTLGPDRPVRHLVVGGRPVVVEGALPGIDLPRLRSDVARIARRLRPPS